MKAYYFLAAAAAVACLTSCNKEVIPTSQESMEETAEITVRLPLPETKAASTLTDNEATVKNLQVYVFNSNGTKLESYGTANASQVTIKVALGEKMIAAVVNSKPITNTVTLESLEKTVVNLQENSLAGGFVMFGKVKKTVAANDNVTIDVDRLVSRVVISKITNNITLPQYSGKALKLKGIYLVNAVNKTNLGSSYALTNDDFSNKIKYEGEQTDLLGSRFATPMEVSAASPYTRESRMYCCPNPVTTDSKSQTWSKRFTRLVVEVEFDGETMYYPISFEQTLKANSSYEIPDLQITRPGSTNPDEPLVLGSVNYTVNVKPWELVSMGTVII